MLNNIIYFLIFYFQIPLKSLGQTPVNTFQSSRAPPNRSAACVCICQAKKKKWAAETICQL